MKIKKPKQAWKAIRTEQDGQTKWFCGEYWRRDGDGSIVLYGKVIDLTESIEPYLNHCNEEVRTLTDICGRLINENLKLRGLTVTERDRIQVFQDMLKKENPQPKAKGRTTSS